MLTCFEVAIYSLLACCKICKQMCLCKKQADSFAGLLLAVHKRNDTYTQLIILSDDYKAPLGYSYSLSRV